MLNRFGQRAVKQPTIKPKTAVRPENWSEFIGHKNIVDMLIQTKQAAESRNEMMRSTLLYGPPGCGKTSLARLVADGNIHEFSAPSMNTVELLQTLMSIANRPQDQGKFIFIDEIHALDKQAQELLYPVIDDATMKFGGMVKPISCAIIGATTELGGIVKPLRDRFSLIIHVPQYGQQEMEEIANRVGTKLGVDVTPGGSYELAKLSRGTPRMAIRIIERLRDFSPTATPKTVRQAAADIGIDRWGLQTQESMYLLALMTLNGQSGQANIQAMLQLDKPTLSEIEQHLISRGMISITGRGRRLESSGTLYLAEKMTDEEQVQS